jgi:glutamate dehydrogenase
MKRVGDAVAPGAGMAATLEGPDELARLVRRIKENWSDRVAAALEGELVEAEARGLAERYAEAFSAEYRAAVEPAAAARDILELEAMAAGDRGIAVQLGDAERAEWAAMDEPITELRLFLRGERFVLSNFMPILENAGLRVIAMSPFEVRGEGAVEGTICLFAVHDTAGQTIDLASRGALLAETILAVRAGDALSDPLNALVLGAGLAWREVDLLRSYAEYAFQSGAVPARLTLPNALRTYPEATRLLVDLFAARFDPALEQTAEARAEAVAAVRASFIASLEQVASLAEDRALRRLLRLIEATVRTNYYRHGGAEPTHRSGGAPYISLKFACTELRDIIRSTLLYEVWVHSSRMAGVHLRGAKVARGGIRHSDRPDDFHTEVTGLVRTQSVKNAVIVPAGSKGGFITRYRHADPKAMGDEAIEQYRTYVRGLLDITDNLVDDVLVPAPGVVAYDEPDSYLVVAADKGTARFSDIANGVSAEYGFWLDDAFASGGSNGYDHKKVGITARGGWECVKRHFREMGHDIQTEPFTVVGIGDMSGDVFGNGMLLSQKTRLVAAFDHRHVFVDPDPDAASSYQERKRLAGLGRSSWDDYDRSLLSKGGFVAARGAKAVELTPEARHALGLPEDITVLDGESLIRAVLAAPVDLIWNGGIGTYIKAASETHAQVGDPSNDAVRVNASELRARVLGEGGNLGVTQRARIEYALAGGRNNTDALDNSGGVDMSDREVNLKILLSAGIAAGRLDREARNKLLEELTPAVTELVLNDNRSQSLAVSLDEKRTAEGVDEFQLLMVGLERDGLLDRASETLPALETLTERRARGEALVRPELAVLLSYSKLGLKRSILENTLPDDPAAAEYLERYFPAAAVEATGREALGTHRLRREIIASQLTNDLTDLMGSTFAYRVARETGRTLAEVARAWLIASRLAGARELRQMLAAAEGRVAARTVYRWLLGLARVLERTTRWALEHLPADLPTTQIIEDYLPGLTTLRGEFGAVVVGEERELYELRVQELREFTAEPGLAQGLITLRFLDQLLEILSVARQTGVDPLRVGQAYYQASSLLQVSWLRQALAGLDAENGWDRRAAQVLADDLGRALHTLVGGLVAESSADHAVDAALGRLTEGPVGIAYLDALAEIQGEDSAGLAALMVAVREIQVLAAHG